MQEIILKNHLPEITLLSIQQEFWCSIKVCNGGRFEGLSIVPIECRASGTDSVMYRLFKRDVFCFWRWMEYGFDKRYRTPYKSWEEIKMNRDSRIKTIKNCKTF